MQRVIIVGSQGAGKTYLARRIGHVLALPVTHLDELYWGLRNEHLTREELNQKVLLLTQEERWVIDGNFLETLEARVIACDTVILLDLPRMRCLWHFVKRRVELALSAKSEQELGPHQRLTWPMAKSIWYFSHRMKPRLLMKITPAAAKEIVILRSVAEVNQFIQTLPTSAPLVKDTK